MSVSVGIAQSNHRMVHSTLANGGGKWKSLVTERFIKPEHVDMVMVEREPAALLQRFAVFAPVAQPKWVT